MRKLALGLLIFIAIGYLCRTQTAGFTPSKIDASAFLATTPDVSAAKPDILDQPFRFLGAGAQSFAFLSEDGTTVLKFIKQSRRRPLPWLAHIRIPSFLEPWRQHILEKRRRNLHNLATSFYMSHSLLSEETGVFYIHLHKNPHLREKKVTLIDNLGIAHSISIDETLFVLQEKVDLPNDLTPARIEAMIDLTYRQCCKGIINTDPVFDRNVGFRGDRALLLDIGSFRKNPRLQQMGKLKEEFLIELLPLRDILSSKYPHLLDTFDAKITSILCS